MHNNSSSTTPPRKASTDGVTLDLRPRERLRVRHQPGLKTVDLRIMEDATGSGAWMATKDGVAVPMGALDDLDRRSQENRRQGEAEGRLMLPLGLIEGYIAAPRALAEFLRSAQPLPPPHVRRERTPQPSTKTIVKDAVEANGRPATRVTCLRDGSVTVEFGTPDDAIGARDAGVVAMDRIAALRRVK